MEANSQLEQEYLLQCMHGNQDAQTELFIQTASLVDRVVTQIKRRIPGHVLKEDLRAAGLEGLWNAIRGFSIDKNVSFESYARIRIRGAILDELRRNDDRTRSERQQLKRAQAAYGAYQQVNAYHVSLDDYERFEWIVDDSSESPEEAAIKSSEVAELNRALVKLSDQERLVLALVFNEGLNLVETAEVMSLSRSRVGAIYNQAIKSLKGSMMRKARK